MKIKIHRWIIGTVIAFLVAMVALTGINCAANPQVVIEKSEKVAVLPIVDSVGADLSWDVAQELTAGVRERINKDLAVASDSAGYDYVVHLELLRYEEVRTGKKPELVADIKMSVISTQDGEVVREEVITSRHLLPNGNGLIDYTEMSEEEYLHTPKAVAHHRMSREVAERIDQVLA